MHNHLLNLISKKVTLSDSDKKYFEPVLFPKNRIIEYEDRAPKYLYFIVSGFMRLFHYNDLGDEVTTHINCPPGFLTAYSSFISQTNSTENVECITECELLRITKNDLDFLVQDSLALKDLELFMTRVTRKILRTVGFFAIFLDICTLIMRAFHLKEYLRHTDSRRFCPLVLFKGQFLAYFNSIHLKSVPFF